MQIRTKKVTIKLYFDFYNIKIYRILKLNRKVKKKKVSILAFHGQNFKTMFGSGKYKGKKKNVKENDFLMFGCPIKNIKENKI